MAGRFNLKLLVLLCLSYACLVYSEPMSAENEDATQINPPECGLSYRQMSQVMAKDNSGEKRYISSTASRQREWGWHVFLFENADTMFSGSLINSQWVLSRAENSE
jgi:hypothetical protein